MAGAGDPMPLTAVRALYRSTIVRMRFHQPTIDYVARRTAEGMPKREIIRCIKRFLAREIYQRVLTDYRARAAVARLESPAPSIPATLAAAV